MTTKQQEFLDALTNPTKAHVKQAADEFYENYSHSIHSVITYEHYPDEYTIEVVANNPGILLATRQILISTIEKHLNMPMINMRTHPEGEAGFFRQSYYVTEA